MEIFAAGAAPVPERVMLWGLPVALSAMLTDALRVPVAVGLNVIFIVQLEPAATLDPQLLFCVKSLAFDPETEMLVILSAALPVLVRVIG